MDLTRVRQALDAAFVRTSVGLSGWPDPRPDGSVTTRDEEYSRCLDPAKYRLLTARAQAWIQALVALGLADAVPSTDPAPALECVHQVRLEPGRPGAIPALIGFRPFNGVPDAVIAIGAGEPTVAVELFPDCGCDACDRGSDDLLRYFDEVMVALVEGTFVHVSVRGGRVQSMGMGWSAPGGLSTRKIEALLDQAREGRRTRGVTRGDRWW